MNKKKSIASKFKEDRTMAIALIALIGFSLFISTTTLSALSGYQSITANWYKVEWPNAWGLGETEVWHKSGNVIQWDANYDPEGNFVASGWTKNAYSAEVEQPKFSRNINYKEWWINDTVSAANPEGQERHFEWAIDIYTVNVNFRVTSGVSCADGAQFWLEFKNNVDSVFEVLGAEGAASYVIYAQTEEYTWTPDAALHHIILPTVSNYELFFLDVGETVPPSIPEEGSDLDFAKLTPYSHVGIKFVFDDFGAGLWETHPTVNMIVELNVLTLGRFDYVLTYVEGGEDEAAPYGLLGVLDSIGAALDAGLSALGDSEVSPMLVSIAVIMGIALVFFIMIKLWFGRTAAKIATGGRI